MEVGKFFQTTFGSTADVLIKGVVGLFILAITESMTPKTAKSW
jgi:hypothetical protein